MSKNIKIIIAVLGIAILSAIVVSTISSSEPKPPTEDQLESIAKMKERDKYRAMPSCESEFVTLEMGDVRLRVRRYEQSIESDEIGNLHSLKKPAPNYNCEDIIKGVNRYTVGDLTIRVWKEKASAITSYKSVNEHFDRHEITLRRELIEDGVERLQVISADSKTFKVPDSGPKIEYFVLPADKAPTFTGEPVLYECGISSHEYQGINRCQTKYFHPSGLHLWISLRRLPDTTNNLLGIDQERRELLENMIIENNIEK